ncbi:adhesion G protein-coupled receptor E2-like [Takifugu rubripes]|uniref:adhesion G protein-coupled receptor E2-like n=1 Tax=Takifugu rubripes TaxID=31033 RepID=UPI0011453BF2|nr:adhesion G protein-coupled receptor E2-like [Takifugu rubripes]
MHLQRRILYIDECMNSTVCGPESTCTNTPGSFTCACNWGWAPTDRSVEPREESNVCIDVGECVEFPTICGPKSNCTNLIGSYNCTCNSGYRLNNLEVIASVTNPCTDIDECAETPGICGRNTVCTNVPGTFFCSCPDGFYPSTGILWLVGTSFCKSIDEVLDEIVPQVGQTKEQAFLGNMNQELQNNTDAFLPAATVTNSLSATMEVSGVGPRARSVTVSSEGDAEAGSIILDISDRLVTTMVRSTHNQTKQSVQTLTVDMSLETVGAEDNDANYVAISARGQALDMNLKAMASANNGSATVAILTLNGMESLLSHQYFRTVNRTEMNSDVFTVLLPTVNNTNLTEPVNFTIQHKKKIPENGIVTCVYWEVGEGGQSSGEKRWSTDGCWISFAHENYTVCSCSHLSTFALIMQIAEPAPANPFLDWLNRVCVIVGLFFFGLAIFTFLLCSWNPKINNTARLHLCLNLSMSHLLLLWNQEYTENELACTVMAGLLHFLVIASFVWMLLEALQLHLLVRRLTKVQVIQRDGLPRPLLYLIGYGVPFTIVGVSALVYSDGYGATEAKMCWLSERRKFNWALTGPVIAILGLNWLLFCATLWSLRTTLANMRSGASQSKDTRLILFKIVAQFVILGCTWILGLYQTNLFFQVLFIILNSQQGTFLFIVHCLLNKEVRDEYIKWLTCTCGKDITVRDAPSVSEDLDKQTDDGKKG